MFRYLIPEMNNLLLSYLQQYSIQKYYLVTSGCTGIYVVNVKNYLAITTDFVSYQKEQQVV